MADQAQLGSMPSISLGGYIPAARQDPKLWQQALASFVSNVGANVAEKGIDAAMSPSIADYDPATGTAKDQPFYKREFTPQEISAMNQGYAAKQGLQLEGKRTDAMLADQKFDQTYKNNMGALREKEVNAGIADQTRRSNAEAARQDYVMDRGDVDRVTDAVKFDKEQELKKYLVEQDKPLRDAQLENYKATASKSQQVAQQDRIDTISRVKMQALSELAAGRKLSKADQTKLQQAMMSVPVDADPELYYKQLLQTGAAALAQ